MIVEKLKALFTLDSSGFEAGMNKAKKQMDSVKTSTEQTSQSINSLGYSFSRSATKITVFGTAMAATGSVIAATTLRLANMAAEIDAIDRGLRFAAGGAQKGADTFQFLAMTSDRLGVSLQKSADAFRGMAASALNTALEGEKVRKIYTSIAEASAVVGLSQHRMQMVFLAVQQMMSKGVISMEEFRRQLGEHLPMATRVMAKSLGVTVAELNKMISMGIVLSDKVLPGFADALHEEVAGSMEEAANSIRASLARLSNAWFLAKKEILTGEGESFLKDVIDRVTEVVKELPKYWAVVEKTIKNVWSVSTAVLRTWTDMRESLKNLGSEVRQLIDLPGVKIEIETDLKTEAGMEGVLDVDKAKADLDRSLEVLRKSFQDKFKKMSREMAFEIDMASLGLEKDFDKAKLVVEKRLAERLDSLKEFYSESIKLYKDHEAERKVLTEEFAAHEAQARLAAAKQIGALEREEATKNLEKMRKRFEQNYGAIVGFLESTTKRITDAFVDMSFGGQKSFKEMTDSILKDLQRLIYQIFVIEPIIKAFRKTMMEATQGIGLLEGGMGKSFLGGLASFASKIFGFADGGIIQEPVIGIGVKSGAGYTLGETGPEMVTPLGEGIPSSVNVTINAIDSQSLVDTMQNNPQAVLGPIVGALQSGDRGMASALRGAL